jgi:hypothetical protein
MPLMKNLHSFMHKNGHFEAIGRVTVAWSALEGSLDMIVAQVSGVDFDTGRAITTHISLGIKLDIINTLLHEQHSGTDMESSWKLNLFPEFKNLQTKRNSIVHAYWLPGFDGEEVDIVVAQKIVSTARGKFKCHVAQMRSEEIDEIANAIYRLASDFEDYLTKYFKHPLQFIMGS